jgi:hypothetical protein
MSPIDAFRNADTLRFAAITFDYKISASFYDRSGSSQAQDVCVVKAPGSLDMQLTATDLGFRQYPLGIPLSGRTVGTDSSGRALVQWKANASPNVYISDADFTVDSVKGTLTAAVSGFAPPTAAPGCDGLFRSFTSHFESASNQDHLIISGHRRVLASDFSADLAISNIVFTGDGGEKSSLVVKILPHKTECGLFAKVGGKARFTAEVSGQPVGEVPQFNWTVIGASPVGSETLPDLVVTLPAASNPVSSFAGSRWRFGGTSWLTLCVPNSLCTHTSSLLKRSSCQRSS